MTPELVVLDKSEAPEVERYVMECTLAIKRTERVGDITSERQAELSGCLSKEVVEVVLDMMREVVQ